MVNIVVDVEIQGGYELLVKIDNLRKTYITKIDEALQRGAEIIFGNAYSMCPIKTGLLRDSIRIEHPNILEYLIIAGNASAYYAIFQEYGFRHFATGNFIINPFMRPAVEISKNDILEEIKVAMELE